MRRFSVIGTRHVGQDAVRGAHCSQTTTCMQLRKRNWRQFIGATRVSRVIVVISKGQEMRVGERRAHGFVVLIHAGSVGSAARRLAPKQGNFKYLNLSGCSTTGESRV